MKNKYATNVTLIGDGSKFDAMEKLATQIERKTKEGLASAFISESYYGADAFCMIANSSKFQKEQGYVVYDLEQQKAIFIIDNEYTS